MRSVAGGLAVMRLLVMTLVMTWVAALAMTWVVVTSVEGASAAVESATTLAVVASGVVAFQVVVSVARVTSAAVAVSAAGDLAMMT